MPQPYRAIISVMADGRERTKDDLIKATPKQDPSRVKGAIDKLTRTGWLNAEQHWGHIKIYKIALEATE